MKEFIQELLAENGKVSSIRAMAFIALMFGGVIAMYGITHPNPDYSGITLLAGMFVGAAFGGKVMQKCVEVDGETTTTTEVVDSDDQEDLKPKKK